MMYADFKLLFFDRQSITDPAEKAKLRNLSRMGAFVMTTDRQSIKDRPGASPPGTPPHAHTVFKTAQPGVTKSGKLKAPKKFYPFKASILFGYDKSRDSVVVGPQFRSGSRTNPTVPHMLEFGGAASIQSRGKTVSASFRPRPHTGPALEKNLPKFAGLFRSSISGG